ncbi:hypothetical protein [Marinobacterium rhizophilum]|uniref:hypothetical protein n=1 Tax=Marinobacterium rhizophilum TaxID=420402 RepID=UPI00037671F7|nr:hypothetical protein [Marinobacterium rhizophilum]
MTIQGSTLTILGNGLMLLSALVLLGAIAISYPLASHFSLVEQILAHLTLIVDAVLLKVAYVIRCTGRYRLGLEV